jgi:hypothetical protein
VDKKKKKEKTKKEKSVKDENPPTNEGHVGSDKPTYRNHARSFDDDVNSKNKNFKPKLPCNIYKGDHLLKDFLVFPRSYMCGIKFHLNLHHHPLQVTIPY